MVENKITVVQPYIKGLPDHAIYLSIIYNEEDQNKWILNNYIHVTCNQNYMQRGFLGFDFYIDYNNCPYIIKNDIPYQMLSQDKTKLHAQLIRLIDSGYSMQVSLDESKILNRQFTNEEKNSFHNNFLYGYDCERKKFSLGFFDKDGRYVFGEIDFGLFHNTFCANEFQKFEIIKHKLNRHYLIDIKAIKRQLIEFLESYNVRELRERYVADNASPYKAFGLDVYTVMANYYEDVILGNIDLDIRPTFLLKERMMCMIRRLQYFEEHGQTKIENSLSIYRMIHSIISKCHNKILYSYVSKNMKKLKGVSEEVLHIRRLEKEAIEGLIKVI